MKYIDIHCHLNLPDFDSDREVVIKRASDAGVGIINVGTDVVTSKKAKDIAEKNENIWATVGIHPSDAKEDFDFSILKEIAKHPKVVAIGECGLDYFHSTPSDFERQKEVFEMHIALANELKKPLMLHVRNGKENKEAYKDAIKILKRHSKVRANFHFFAGSMEDLKSILDLDCTVSFTGVITFARNYDEIVKYVPIGNIMSETDAPLVAPLPNRGKRNEPLFVMEVARKIAEIRAEDEPKVLSALVDNAQKMFAI